MSTSLNRFLTRTGVNRLRLGHPWVYARHLKEELSLPATPALVPLGEHWFLYSPQSEIRLRRLGPATRMWPSEDIPREIITDIGVFTQHFKAPLIEFFSKAYRTKQQALGGEKLLRWVFGDTDGLGGLVLDIFGDTAVAQIQSAPLEYFWKALTEIFNESFNIVSLGSSLTLIGRRDSPIRKKEGLPVVEYTLDPEPRVMQWGGLQWYMNPGAHQKTGAYLDQIENHRRALDWAKKLECTTAWDICCFEGGFGVGLAHAGISVTAVDSSAAALKRGFANAKLNNCSENFNPLKSDAFEFLRNAHQKGKKVDMIVLDPPALARDARTEKAKHQALKAYRELNLRALHCLKPGGLLVTCTCSHAISEEDFRGMLSQAQHHARRGVRILETAGPAPDHTPSLHLPEAAYLYACFVQVDY